MTTQSSTADTAEQSAQTAQPTIYDAQYHDAHDQERRKLYATYSVPELPAPRPRKGTRLAR